MEPPAPRASSPALPPPRASAELLLPRASSPILPRGSSSELLPPRSSGAALPELPPPSSPALDILGSGPVLPVAIESTQDRLWTARSIAAGLLIGLAVAALGYLVLSGQLARRPSWLAGPLIAVALGGVALLGQVRRWRDRKPMSVTGFVGPRPLTRADREQYGFFGREVETEHAVDKLRNLATRCLVLSGERGCGKTSLLLAGVIPRLESELGCRCIYVAMDEKPVWALRQALRLAAGRAASEPGPTRLKDDLEQAQRRAGRPVVLFIDQFEEFGTSPVSSEDHLALIELFQCVLGSPVPELLDVQLVFSVRSDQLALIDDLGRSAGPASTGSAEARLALQPLELPAAREIIDELARRSGLRLEWPLGVVERLVEDLATEQVHFGRTRRIVHAAELQMVCQMVCHLVSTRRIRTAADYPGKQQLLIAYLGRSIRSVPGLSPPRALELLLNLSSADGQPRAVSRSLPQLAAELRVRPERLLPALNDLVQRHRLVVRLAQRGEQGEPVTVYRLALPYLTDLLHQASGGATSGRQRSEAILRTARLRAEYRRGYHLSLREFYHLRRHRPAPLDRGERSLMRRTALGLGLRSVVVLLAIAALGALRFASYRLELQKNELVFKRGLPVLHPLLGSAEVTVASGLSRDDLPNGSEVSRRLFAPLAQGSRLYLPGPRRLGPSFDAQSALREQLVTVGSAYLEKQRNPYSQKSALLDSTVGDWLIVANDALARDPGNQQLKSYYQARLLESFTALEGKCRAAEPRSPECSEAVGALQSLAANLLKAGSAGEGHDKAEQLFTARLTAAPPGSWSFDVALAVLRLWRGREPSLRSLLAERLADKSLAAREALIGGLALLPRAPQDSIFKIVKNPALVEELTSQLMAVLEDPAVSRKERLDALTALTQLSALGAPSERLLKLLSAQLELARTAGDGTGAPAAATVATVAPAQPAAAAKKTAAAKRNRGGARRGAKSRTDAPPADSDPAAPPAAGPGSPAPSPGESEQPRAGSPSGPAASRPEPLTAIDLLRALIKLKVGSRELKVNSGLIVAATLDGLRGAERPAGSSRPEPAPGEPASARPPVASWTDQRLPYIDLIGAYDYHWNQLFGEVRGDEVRDALGQALQSYLEASLPQSLKRPRGELEPLIRAARRAGASVHEVAGWLPDRESLRAEPGDYERNLLAALEAVYRIDDAEEDRIVKEQRVPEHRAELVRWVNEYIDQDGQRGCRWAAVALNYQIVHPAIANRIDDPDCRTATELHRAYAQFRLLRHTRGFDEGARLGAISSGEASDKSESFHDASVRLLQLLSSAQADACSTYRSAVRTALEDLIRRQREQPDGLESLAELRRLVMQERLRPQYPLQRQLALLEVWTALLL